MNFRNRAAADFTMAIDAKNQEIMEVVGQKLSDTVKNMFSSLRSENALKGQALLKIHGQLGRQARSIEQRMIDTAKAFEVDELSHPLSTDLEKALEILDSPSREERISEAVKLAKSARETYSYIAGKLETEKENGGEVFPDILLKGLSHAFISIVISQLEVEEKIYSLKDSLKAEILEMANFLNL